MSSPSTNQSGFRGRNDNGSQTTATWKANLNTNWTQDTGQVFRVRIAVQEVNSKSVTVTPNLFYSKNGGAYAQVTPSSANVRLVSSAYVTDATVTSQQISSGTFVSGAVESNGSVDGVSLNGSITEMEYVLELVGADLATGNTIALRVYNNTTALNAYGQTPSITANVAAQNLDETASAAKTDAVAVLSEINAQEAQALPAARALQVDGGLLIEETLYDFV